MTDRTPTSQEPMTAEGALARAYWSVDEDDNAFWPSVLAALTDLGYSVVPRLDDAELGHLRTELVLRTTHLPDCGDGAEFPWDCTCDYIGFMNRMGVALRSSDDSTPDGPR